MRRLPQSSSSSSFIPFLCVVVVFWKVIVAGGSGGLLVRSEGLMCYFDGCILGSVSENSLSIHYTVCVLTVVARCRCCA